MLLRFYRATNGIIDTSIPLPEEGVEVLFKSVKAGLSYPVVDYKKVFVRNDGQTTVTNVVLYIDEQTPAPGDDIWLAVGTENDTESDAVNYNFSQPTSSSPIMLATEMQPGQVASFWIKRVVNVNAESFSDNYFRIAVSYLYIPD